MKTFFDSFRNYIYESNIESYVENINIRLYHYAFAEEKEIILDPSRFGTSSFSRREKESSTIPRIFFYVDLEQRERFVASGRNLYSVDVSAASIYDLNSDPEGFKQKIAHPVYGLRKGVEIDELLKMIGQSYSGAFYTSGAIDMVIYFEPISVERDEDKQKELMVN